MPIDTQSAPASAATEAQPVEKLYMENTLLRVSGALFCHDAKRAASRKEKIELNRGAKENRIVVEPHPNYGQPGPLAHKIFVALIKKHSDYGRPAPDEVSFTKREIMRLTGRAEWGGRDSVELSQAIEEIRNTSIIAFFKNEKDSFFERRFHLFSDVLIERKNSHRDPIEACTITIAKPIIASLHDEHFTCLNHFLLMRLGTIGQALYMRLFFHFANLYEQKNKKRLSFSKRYDDICNEWLGGLTVLSYRAQILRDQLGTHLTQLVNVGVLASYSVEKAKTRDGFVVGFRPGAAFFQDYDRFYRHRRQGELQWDYHGDRQEIAEPLKVAYLFTEHRTGGALKDISYVSSKDVETAKLMLEQVPFAEMADFIEYGLAEAKTTKFEVKTLGGLKQYLPSYLKSREHRAAAKAAAAAKKVKEQEEADRIAYDRFRRSEAERVYEALPADEQSIIEALARANTGRTPTNGTGSLAQMMYQLTKNRITLERHPGTVASFETWQAARQKAPV